MTKTGLPKLAAFLPLLVLLGCADDDRSEADRLGVGAQCGSDADCDQSTITQVCLKQFKGGYCGVANCNSNIDCPDPSACVQHDDGETYCFRSCSEKLECNVNRTADNEANCVSNVTYVESEPAQGKSCVPPSSGTE